MKRTAERVLGIIGLVLFVIGGGLLAMSVPQQQSGQLEEAIIEQLSKGSEGQELTADDYELAEFFAELPYGTFALASFIAAVAGLVAVIIVSKKPVISGVLFLAMIVIYGLMVGLWMFLLSFLPIIMYLIAGIMSLVRRGSKDSASLQE
ncbi:DUF4064 domain-containing protein [Bacillus sp. FSL W7-1360]